MKRKKIARCLGAGSIAVISIVFVAIVVFALSYMFTHPLSGGYYIFQNISECEQLIPNDQSGVTVDRYDSPDKDTNLNGLLYKEFWGMNLSSDEIEYEIFAYEFEDSDSALKYYVNETGQNSYLNKLPLSMDDENKLFSASKGIPSYRLIVIYKNRAYKVISPSKYADSVNELLASIFSQKVFE